MAHMANFLMFFDPATKALLQEADFFADANPYFSHFPDVTQTQNWLEWSIFWAVLIPICLVVLIVIIRTVRSETHRKLARSREAMITHVVSKGNETFAETRERLNSAALSYRLDIAQTFQHTSALSSLAHELSETLDKALNAKASVVSSHQGGQGNATAGGMVFNINVSQPQMHVHNDKGGAASSADLSQVKFPEAAPVPLSQTAGPALKYMAPAQDHVSRVFMALSDFIKSYQSGSGMRELLSKMQIALFYPRGFKRPKESKHRGK